jgi:hypothetical protein
MRDRFPRLAALLGLLLAAALIAGCGGDENSVDGDTDPQTILDEALGGGEPIESGDLDLQFDLESPSDSGGKITASLTGPFQSSSDGSLPALDFDVKALVDAAGSNIDFEGGVTLTSDAGYISYAGKDYELDSGTFDLLQSSYQQSSQLQDQQGDQNSSLSQFGIDPSAWVTDLTNEGTEDLDGTEVVHISGSADVPKLVEDLTTVAEQTGQAKELNPSDLQQLDDSVEQADIDVYAASDDSTLREFDLEVQLADPTGSGAGPTTVSLKVGIGNPGEDQQIEAPSDAQPIAALLQQFPQLGSLQGLGAAGAAPTGSGSGSSGASSDAASQYYQCAAAAKTPQEVSACADLLGG